MIAPEEDFDTWIAILMATLQPKDEYPALLPDFTRLINEYSTKGELPDPLQPFSTNFAESAAPTIITKILELQYLPTNELEIVESTLKAIIDSSITGFINHIPNCDKYLIQLLDSKLNLYTKPDQYSTYNRSSAPSYFYQKIANYFSEKSSKFILLINSEPTLNNLSIIAQILANIPYNQQFVHNLLIQSSDAIFKILKSIDQSNLRNIDKIQLSQIISLILPNLHPQSDLENLINCLLEFGDMCLRSDFIDKKILGSQIFEQISLYSIDYLIPFAQKTNLIEYIVDTEFHEKIQKKMSTVFSEIFENDQNSSSLLSLIYQKIQTAHSNKKLILYDYLATALSSIQKDEIVLQFLHQIKSEAITAELLQFLLKMINQIASSTITSQIVLFILNLYDNSLTFNQNKEIIEQTIEKLCSMPMFKESRIEIFKFTKKFL